MSSHRFGRALRCGRGRRLLQLSLPLMLVVAFTGDFLQAEQARSSPPSKKSSATTAAASKGPARSSPPINESPVVSRQLANGLEILVYEDHSVPLVTVEYSAIAGSLVEKPEENGYSHLIEHVFWKLPAKVSAYLKDPGQLGISYNGTTREEQSNEYLVSTSNNFGVMLHVLSDLVRFPAFTPENVEREKQVVLGEYDRNESNPYAGLAIEVSRQLYYKYPWTRNPIGSREAIRQATPEKLKAFFTKYWAPNNSVVVIAGDVTPQQAFARAEEFFGDWARGPATFAQDAMVQHPALPKNKGAVIQTPIASVVLELGWLGPSITQDPQGTYAADVFSNIVRQPDSRLEKLLVDSGLATAFTFGYYTQKTAGPITLLTVTSPDKVRFLIPAIQKEIEHFADPDYFTDQELENAKTLLGAEDLYSREKPSEYSHTLSFWATSASVSYWKSYQASVGSVSRADIARYLKTYVVGKPHVTALELSEDQQKKLEIRPEELER